MTAAAPLQVYQPLAQRSPGYATLMVRTSLPPETLADAARAALWRIDPEIPVSDVAPMTRFVNRSIAQPRLYLVLFGLFAGLALLLAMVGLFGILAYSVQQRIREFGVRKALGASPRSVVGLVAGNASRVFVAGAIGGLTLSYLMGRLVSTMLFGVKPTDPVTYVGVTVILALSALAAAIGPAWRAIRIEPATALRHE